MGGFEVSLWVHQFIIHRSPSSHGTPFGAEVSGVRVPHGGPLYGGEGEDYEPLCSTLQLGAQVPHPPPLRVEGKEHEPSPLVENV